jgi:hypothetical protein
MNIGYDQILQMRRVEEKANALGFMFAHPGDRGWSYPADHGVLSLKPKDDDSLPIYNRDAQLFTGTLDAVEYFLRGIEFARNYDTMIKVSTEAVRNRKEQDERNKRLVNQIKNSGN